VNRHWTRPFLSHCSINPSDPSFHSCNSSNAYNDNSAEVTPVDSNLARLCAPAHHPRPQYRRPPRSVAFPHSHGPRCPLPKRCCLIAHACKVPLHCSAGQIHCCQTRAADLGRLYTSSCDERRAVGRVKIVLVVSVIEDGEDERGR